MQEKEGDASPTAEQATEAKLQSLPKAVCDVS